MPRRFRSPEYDLQKHIINGARPPQSGQGIVRDVDNAELNRDDPTEFTAPDGRFGSLSIQAITASYLAEADGLSNVASGDPIDVKVRSGSNDNEYSETGYGRQTDTK